MVQEALTFEAEMQVLAAELGQHQLRVHQPGDPPLMTPEPMTAVERSLLCFYSATRI